ncbi:MAG TPA: hypothetical protein VIF62_37485 [Labilithrix sp.]
MAVRGCVLLFVFVGCASTSATIVDGGVDAGRDAVSCGDIQAHAMAEVHDAEARATEDLSCSADRECAYVYEFGYCGDRPCDFTVQNEAGAAAVAAAIARASSTTCAPFGDAGCILYPPPPCAPPPYGPYCNAGRCSEQRPVDAGDDG